MQSEPAGWRSKRAYGVETRASVAILCDPVFAEVCTGKGINRPDNRRFFQVVKRVAVNNSIGQGGDYASAAGAERRNCFCVKKVFYAPALRLPSPALLTAGPSEERESLF